MAELDTSSELYRAVATLVAEACKSAYWYGEDTGDYDMASVRERDWFVEIVNDIIAVNHGTPITRLGREFV